MRIGVDLQPLQAATSAKRGIGVYVRNQMESLLRLDRENEYVFFYNKHLPRPQVTGAVERVEWRGLPIASSFLGIRLNLHGQNYPDDRFLYTSLLHLTLLRDGLDLIHATSPFEWEAFVATRHDACPTVVTLYDLIPLIFHKQYLAPASPEFREAYLQRLKPILRADRLIAISEASKRDAVRLLGLPEERIDVAGGGAHERFRVLEDEALIRRVRQKFDLDAPYILSVAGYHFTKNLEGVIASFRLLPEAHRQEYQLCIVCRLLPPEEQAVRCMAERHGIAARLVLTNEVSDGEMVALYNGATVLSYPSFYDGFGLPVLEAMRCGLPVVTSNVSSLPEVAGDAALLVAPYDHAAIATALESVLSDRQRRQEMRDKGLQQAARFSWGHVAELTLQTYEQAWEASRRRSHARQDGSLRIAYFSPLNPQKSGVADYSEELLPHLAKHADLELFVDGYQPTNEEIAERFPVYDYHAYPELAAHRSYDAVLYQMGNSAFHEYIYKTLLNHSGVVVMHDLTLHGFFHYITRERGDWRGYLGEVEFCEGKEARRHVELGLWRDAVDVFAYPLNRRVVQASQGVIVHSHWAAEQLQGYSIPVAVIPHGVTIRNVSPEERLTIRARLSIPEEVLLISSFGHIAGTKRPDVMLRAFRRLGQAVPQALLLLVGELSPDLREAVPRIIAELGLNEAVRITGYTSLESFLDYMRITDVAVNLRYPSAGETSGSLCRLLGLGKPVVVSNIGQFQEFPDDCCWKLDVDEHEEDLLVAYLLELARNEPLRRKMGDNAHRYVAETASWEQVAGEYAAFLRRVGSTKREGKSRS